MIGCCFGRAKENEGSLEEGASVTASTVDSLCVACRLSEGAVEIEETCRACEGRETRACLASVAAAESVLP